MPTPNQLRSDIDELVRLANRDLGVLLRGITAGPQATAVLVEALPLLSDSYGLAAGSLTADWYENTRVELGVRGRYLARVADVPGRERTDILARWATGPLFNETPDELLAYSKASGGLQRLITDVSRDTVIGSSVSDRRARGWQRSAVGDGCGFCQMLASRGAVYSESTVSFGAHDHCRCVAVPAFDGAPRLVDPYTPSERNVTPADRARTREWMAENGY